MNQQNSRPAIDLKSKIPIVAVALISWVWIVACIDPAGSYPALPEGPGLTVDEIFNVEQGCYLVERTRALGWLNLIPTTSQEAYRRANGYNPDHPPLGRWWLGLHHSLAWQIAPPNQPDGLIVTACARTGSATAFAITILLIGWFAAKWWGNVAGFMTAISFVCMPRVFGHAHLAALETITNLTCTTAVLVVAYNWFGPNQPTKRAAIYAGVFLGLALLTKIQAILLPIPIGCWAIWRWRQRAIIPLMLWGMTAFIVFFSLWPYLWEDPVARIAEYLGRATQRSTINVWYFGQTYPDKGVPWHYGFVMFLLTVPVILHLVGLLGFAGQFTSRMTIQQFEAEPSNSSATSEAKFNRLKIESRTEPDDSTARDILLLAWMVFPLVVFALPNVAVYDGERLFLTSFPMWAIFIGRGWSVCWNLINRVTNSTVAASVVCGTFLLLEASPLFTMAPCYLSYYNGITRLLTKPTGRPLLEVDYWGEGITRELLQQLVEIVPQGNAVALVPTMHQFQVDDYVRQSPILRSHGITFVEFQTASAQEFVVVYCRYADLPPDLDFHSQDFQILASIKRQGDIIAFLCRRTRLSDADE